VSGDHPLLDAVPGRLRLSNPRIKYSVEQQLPDVWGSLLVKLRDKIIRTFNRAKHQQFDAETIALVLGALHPLAIADRSRGGGALYDTDTVRAKWHPMGSDAIVAPYVERWQEPAELSVESLPAGVDRDLYPFLCTLVLLYVRRKTHGVGALVSAQTTAAAIAAATGSRDGGGGGSSSSSQRAEAEAADRKIRESLSLLSKDVHALLATVTLAEFRVPFAGDMLFCYWNPLGDDERLRRVPLCNLPYYVVLCTRVNYLLHLVRLIAEALFETQETSREATREDTADAVGNSGAAGDASVSALHYKRMLNRTHQWRNDGNGPNKAPGMTRHSAFAAEDEIANNSALDHLLHFDTSCEHYKFDTPDKYAFYAVMCRLKSLFHCHLRLMAQIEQLQRDGRRGTLLRFLSQPALMAAQIDPLPADGENIFADDLFDAKTQLHEHVGPTHAEQLHGTLQRFSDGGISLCGCERGDWEQIAHSRVQGQTPLDWTNQDRVMFDEGERRQLLQPLLDTGRSLVAEPCHSCASQSCAADAAARYELTEVVAERSGSSPAQQQQQQQQPTDAAKPLQAPWASPPTRIDIASAYDAIKACYEGKRFDAAARRMQQLQQQQPRDDVLDALTGVDALTCEFDDLVAAIDRFYQDSDRSGAPGRVDRALMECMVHFYPFFRRTVSDAETGNAAVVVHLGGLDKTHPLVMLRKTEPERLKSMALLELDKVRQYYYAAASAVVAVKQESSSPNDDVDDGESSETQPPLLNEYSQLNPRRCTIFFACLARLNVAMEILRVLRIEEELMVAARRRFAEESEFVCNVTQQQQQQRFDENWYDTTLHQSDDPLRALREAAYRTHMLLMDHVPMLCYMLSTYHVADDAIRAHDNGRHYVMIRPRCGRYPMCADLLPALDTALVRLDFAKLIKKKGINVVYLLSKVFPNICQIRKASGYNVAVRLYFFLSCDLVISGMVLEDSFRVHHGNAAIPFFQRGPEEFVVVWLGHGIIDPDGQFLARLVALGCNLAAKLLLYVGAEACECLYERAFVEVQGRQRVVLRFEDDLGVSLKRVYLHLAWFADDVLFCFFFIRADFGNAEGVFRARPARAALPRRVHRVLPARPISARRPLREHAQHSPHPVAVQAAVHARRRQAGGESVRRGKAGRPGCTEAQAQDGHAECGRWRTGG
jgi:hypothetical protein